MTTSMNHDIFARLEGRSLDRSIARTIAARVTEALRMRGTPTPRNVAAIPLTVKLTFRPMAALVTRGLGALVNSKRTVSYTKSDGFRMKKGRTRAAAAAKETATSLNLRAPTYR